jgi:hypothetical protein
MITWPDLFNESFGAVYTLQLLGYGPNSSGFNSWQGYKIFLFSWTCRRPLRLTQLPAQFLPEVMKRKYGDASLLPYIFSWNTQVLLYFLLSKLLQHTKSILIGQPFKILLVTLSNLLVQCDKTKFYMKHPHWCCKYNICTYSQSKPTYLQIFTS